MNLNEYKEKAFRDNPNFKKEYEKFDLLFEIQELFIKIRLWFLSRFKK